MNSWNAIDMIWLVAVLVAVVSSLSVRRMSMSFVVRSIAAWAAIALVVFVAVAHRYELQALFNRATAALGIDEQQVAGKTVRIRMSPDGHFWARVTINGVERRMLVDSGATVTAISAETAAAVGIDPADGMPVFIETANGTIQARQARAQHLAIGPLRTEDLGVVVSDSFGDMDVIGMNFLSRLSSWRVENKVLVLEPRADADDDGSDATTSPAEAPRRSGDGRGDAQTETRPDFT